jgi:hypothetical protein
VTPIRTLTRFVGVADADGPDDRPAAPDPVTPDVLEQLGATSAGGRRDC